MGRGEYFIARLVLSVISNLLIMGAIYAVWRWALPEMGLSMSVYVLVVILVLFAIFSVFMFILGTKTLSRIGQMGMSSMIGMAGKVAKTIDSNDNEGVVLIKGELWNAKSAEGKVSLGEKIEVVGEDGMILLVRRKQVGKLVRL